MMKPIYFCLASTLLTALVSTPQAIAQQDTSNMSTEQRLQRLERLVESQGLVDIMVRLDSLQQEVQQLRGQSEVQAHQIEELKKRQRELYIDIDRRLLQLERNGAPAASSTDKPVVAPSTTTSQNTTRPAVQPQVSGAAREQQPSVATRTPELPEQEAYQQAFDLLRELQYDKATLAFRRFLDDYPNGRYAHIALYWLGEANYAQRKFKQAISDYQNLISSYPDSPKVAEAMLKIGYSYNELQDYKQAQAILQKLVDKYPGTTEAGQARNLMQKIRANLNKG
jgi:tol-pal system protein YbgF